MYAIIFLDTTEVVIYIYKFTKEHQLIVLNTITYNLTFDLQDPIDAAHIVAVLMSMFLSHKTFILTWRLISRGIAEEVVEDVAKTLDIPFEVLTRQREQELLCKAVVRDLVR